MNNSIVNKRSLESLIKEYKKSKCNHCFGELYKRYFNQLHSYCRKITNDNNEAYDVAMEAFIKAIEKINALKAPEYFGSWLYRIAHNLIMDDLRNKKKLTLLNLKEGFDVIDDKTDHELLLEKEVLLQQMNYILNKIEPKHKAILVAKYIHNNSISEIKNQLGITESATKMRIARAKRRVAGLAS